MRGMSVEDYEEKMSGEKMSLRECPRETSGKKYVGGIVQRNVRITIQEYKSLHAVVVICATLVNT